jgi:glycosyltransferase involved in cell wall biosynthesis
MLPRQAWQKRRMTEPAISIVMPAYNAGAHLPGILERIPADAWPQIIRVYILNDGSRDDTGPIADALAGKYSQVSPVHFPVNRGYGAAVRAGLELCRKDKRCVAAVCLHADGQYPPERIPAALAQMRAEGLDILQGSRIASGTALAGGMPLYKYVANRALTSLENRAFKLRLTDYHSGMLFYSRRALDTLPFAGFSDSFEFDVEVIACARARGLNIGEIPIPTHYGGETSHVSSVRYGFRVLAVVKKYVCGGYGRP